MFRFTSLCFDAESQKLPRPGQEVNNREVQVKSKAKGFCALHALYEPKLVCLLTLEG